MDNDLQGDEAQNESVFVSYDKLRSFASMDILWSEITGNPGPSPILTDGTKIEFETVYNMTLDDLKCALEKAYDVKMSTGLFAAEWLWPVCNYCFDMLGLADLYEDPRIIPAYHVRTIPEDENDVLKWAFSYISESVADEIGYGRDMNLPLSGAVDIRGILDMISVSTEDEDTDPLERDYPDVFMRDYIMNLDNDLILGDADTRTRTLFRVFTDKLADRKDFEGMRIKAYALYGGNSIYECDYKKSAEYLECLWRDNGFGYAANTLAHMYREGLLTDGKPDLGNAFRYFSIGGSYKISDSLINLAKMFMHGEYVKRDAMHAKYLISTMYDEYREGFTAGYYDCPFAEVAYWRGVIETEDIEGDPLLIREYRAVRYFLQARFALGFKSGMSMIRTDEVDLKAKINRAIDSLHSKIRIRKTRFKTGFPEPLYEFVRFHSHSLYMLTVKSLKGKNTKITAERMPKKNGEEAEMSLVTYPEFACCDLTDSISVTVENCRFTRFTGDENAVILFDSLETVKTETGEIVNSFCLSGTPVAFVHGDSYIIGHP
ncbi:MAG: sel1 repeat family protein [Clostridiales bacterium]|nr:sel1 repeat family protein [Clostridiales bacterium]